MRKSRFLRALLFCTVICFMAGCCQETADCPNGSFCLKGAGDCEGDGVCTDTPDACPDIYAPVCGCDGKTYDNDCEAGKAGVCIAYEGECTDVCKGNDNCGKGDYCAKPVGDCEGEGVCTEIPEVCPDIWAPVCGCDGETYGNDCEAAAAGVTISYEGECTEGCKVDDDCEKGNYCAKPVGDCEGEGICAEIPEGCPDVWAPVCGCDGETYGNDCEAAAAGVTISYEGECTEGCKVGDDCEKGYYCAKPVGDCEGEGVCAKMLMICPEIYAPVCGCDGKTYGNDCLASAAGVNVDYEGECGEGCKGNDNCEEGYYCAKPVGDCEGEGVCTEMSEICPMIYAPVCGCDGNTYANDCVAAAAGVNVDYEGECSEGCKGNDDCEKGQYCATPVGDCEGEGVCAEMPEICPMIYAPVCGCDGKTYANDCVAAAAGVNVDYEGECKAFFCPRSKGYWKNHPGEWPVDELMIGCEIYGKEKLLEILKSPSKGDMELILKKQLIPAKLNKAAGADVSSIDKVIDQADECLETCDCSRGRLEDLKDKLDRFNNSGEDCYDNGCDDKCDDTCGCDDKCCGDCRCNDCGCDDKCDDDCGCDDKCDDDCGCDDKCDDDCGCDDKCDDDCGCDDKCDDDCDDDDDDDDCDD